MSSARKKSETLTILFSMKVSVVYRNSKVTASLFILVVTFWSLYCSKDQQQYPSDKSPGFGYGEWFMRSVALLTLCTTVIIWWKHFSCTKYSSLDGEIVLSSSNKVSSQKKKIKIMLKVNWILIFLECSIFTRIPKKVMLLGYESWKWWR